MKDVVIVGAGIIGLSTAYYAALRGHRVTVIDRGSEEHENCSYGNAGYICPSHFVPLAAPGMVAMGLKWMLKPDSPFYIKPRFDWDLLSWGWKFYRAANAKHVVRSAPLLAQLQFGSRQCVDEMVASTGNTFGWEKKGLLCLCKTEQRLHHEAELVDQARQLGLKAEVLDARAVAAFDPNVRMDIVGGVYFADDCHLTPGRLMATLKQQLKKMGVAFTWSTEVTGWRVKGGRIRSARTSQNGDVAADEFVICGGSWSPLLARELGINLPMQAGKGYSLTLPKPRYLLALPAILTEARVAVTPMGNSLRFGGTMEIAGLNEGINPVRVQGIINSVSKYYPDFSSADFAGVKPWSGLRPCSPDGLPYVGRTCCYPNLSVATGHAMLGLSLGPITGKLIAEIISDQTCSHDIRLLNPDRYM